MSEVIANLVHHEYAERVGPAYDQLTLNAVKSLTDLFVLLDKQLLLLSSALDGPTIALNKDDWDVFHFLFCRGIKTFRSIRVLLGAGCDQDAMALLRNLVETFLTTKFIAGADTKNRAQRFRDFAIVERYRNMLSYRDARFADFDKLFPNGQVEKVELEMKTYTDKYQVKYSPTLSWSNMSPYKMASQPEVDMLHDYLQGFSTYSMLTHSSFQARESYMALNKGVRTISWAPTGGLATSVGMMASGFMLKLAQVCISVMGIDGLDHLIAEIQCNIAARMDSAGYKTGSLGVSVEPGKWGVLKKDSETGNIIT